MKGPVTLLWFRLDLRLSDHPALDFAIRQGGSVVPVFISAPEEEGEWAPGGASRWWLHQSLRALDFSLRERASRLIFRQGPTEQSLFQLIEETGANSVVWTRRYEPEWMARDSRVKSLLKLKGISAESFNGTLLNEPWCIQNKSGNPFQVFTPFWKACLSMTDPEAPLPPPGPISSPASWPKSLELSVLKLEPKIPWDATMRVSWEPGEVGAAAQLKRFAMKPISDYSEDRNHPSISGTSRLSPHLHFGEISPRQVWHALRAKGEKEWRASQYVTELGWREFAFHLLYHFPETPNRPLRKNFEKFPWNEKNGEPWKAWTQGETGIPIIDAGMRELWATGWMHNRVRMLVASFLVKNLRFHWIEGARWFWETLVDADLAANTLGWQWTAGCGADAAPYFRIFNPVTQGEKFDSEGTYVRRWVPELSRLPAQWIHRPSEATEAVLREAGITLGVDYPRPIVRLDVSREEALKAFKQLPKGKTA